MGVGGGGWGYWCRNRWWGVRGQAGPYPVDFSKRDRRSSNFHLSVFDLFTILYSSFDLDNALFFFSRKKMTMDG